MKIIAFFILMALLLPIAFANSAEPTYAIGAEPIKNIIYFLIALIITLIIEIPVFLLYTFIARKDLFKDLKTLAKAVGVVAVGTIISLPFLWFVFPAIITDWLLVLLVGELFVFLFEALLIHALAGFSKKDALLASFVINVASFSIGGLILLLLVKLSVI